MRAAVVTDADVALLRTLSRAGSVVEASRRVGMTRDRATYRIARLGRAFGSPVVESVRGGRGHGLTRLTSLGRRIARQGFTAVELKGGPPSATARGPNRVRGVYRGRPSPAVELRGGDRMRVAFGAAEGERLILRLDPESILVARTRFASSARNVLAGTVDRVLGPHRRFGTVLVVRTKGIRLRVAITPDSVRQLALAPGTPVWLYIKATALHPERPARSAAAIREFLPT